MINLLACENEIQIKSFLDNFRVEKIASKKVMFGVYLPAILAKL